TAVSAAALVALGACGDNAAGPTTQSGVLAVGSSTVFPFASRVAENFSRTSGGAAPRVESLGTGGGIQKFCEGVGGGTPDIANASRPMKASETDRTQKPGVNDLVVIKLGVRG